MASLFTHVVGFARVSRIAVLRRRSTLAETTPFPVAPTGGDFAAADFSPTDFSIA